MKQNHIFFIHFMALALYKLCFQLFLVKQNKKHKNEGKKNRVWVSFYHYKALTHPLHRHMDRKSARIFIAKRL